MPHRYTVRTNQHPFDTETAQPGGTRRRETTATTRPQGERHTLKLTITAITASILAILGATPVPVIGHNADIQRLAIGASAVLWIILWTSHLAGRIQNGVGETRAEVHEYKQHTDLAKLLREAGQPIDGGPLTLPMPSGNISAVPVNIDGAQAIVGVDESTHLADVIELRRAITDNGRAAQ